MIRAVIVWILLLGGLPDSKAEEVSSVAEAFKNGSAHVSFRYRYEQVDQDGITKKANASTLKTRINFRTAAYHGFSMFLEADDLSYVGDDKFNNTRNGRANYPVVADPDGTDINQAYVNLATESADYRLGRQRINRDNQRFVGGVGWRQNEQSFDAFDISTRALPKTTIRYTYIDKVSRIFGPEKGTPDKTLDSKSHLLNAAIDGGESGQFVLYTYALEFDNALGLSNRTHGIRYMKTFKLDSVKVPLILEYSVQGDHGDNPSSYSANYYLAGLEFKFEKASLGFGYEVLEGSNTAGEAFQTPLATLHKFQGWADKFLATPAGGIEDAYISAGFHYGQSDFAAVFHNFDAETGSANYGSEWDLSWNYTFNDHFSLLAKAARYDAGDYSMDTTKLWLMFSVNF